MELLKNLRDWWFSSKHQGKKHHKAREIQLKNVGQELWRRLDAKLPKAKGIKEDDKERLELFKNEVMCLSLLKKIALRHWLRTQTRCMMEGGEHTNAVIEAYEQKWWQIYSSHLEIMDRLITQEKTSH